MVVKISADKANSNKILVYAETKRIAENLTKKELCSILGINDNFYIGCIAGRAKPSQPMLESLVEYINMKTKDVYFKVFAFRSTLEFIGRKQEKKFMIVGDNVWKERYSDHMKDQEENFATIVEQLKENDILRVPM